MSIPKFKILLITGLLILFSVLKANAFISDFSKKLDSIQLIYDKDKIRLPGQKFEIGIIAYYNNGKIKKTRNLDDGTLFWNFFTIEVSGGSHFAGKVKVSDKLYPSKGKYISIKAWPGKGKHMSKELLLPLNYESEIEIIPTSNIVRAAGFKFNFKILAKFDNGDIKEYSFRKRDLLKSKYYLFATNGGEIFKNQFHINQDFRLISDHKVYLTAISKRNPDCVSDFTLNLDYKADYLLTLRGSDEYFGSSGFSGSIGSEGCNGGDGGSGGNIYLYFTEDALIYKDLIVPSTRGGFGGSLGSGGFGGSGGSGGNDSPNGSDGRSGWNGQSGWSGSFGWGGKINFDTTEDLVNLDDE